MKGNKILRVLFLIASVVFMVMIFNFSAENGQQSTDTTTEFIEKTEEILIDVGIIEENGPSLQSFSGYIRKFAHVFLYLGLSFFVTLFTFTFDLEKYKVLYFILPVAFCFLYACGDELHQYFVPDRAGVFTDVLIDGIGFVLSALTLNLFRLLFRKKELK